MRQGEKERNDTEQYQRRWNLRLYGVRESEGEDVVGKCLQIFNDKVGVEVDRKDIQVAHRVKRKEKTDREGATQKKGKKDSPRSIIVQFQSRSVRSDVLVNRSKLKGSGVSIGEDMTAKNLDKLQKVQDHSAILAAWYSNGKIFAHLKNGKKVNVNIHTNLDEFFRAQLEGASD